MCNDFHSSGASHAIIPPSNDLEISSLPATQKHLATKRRIGSPQASGRTEVFVFSSAIETPPATYRFRNAGARPHENSLTADVSALVKTNDSARTHCCKRRFVPKQACSRTRAERAQSFANNIFCKARDFLMRNGCWIFTMWVKLSEV